MTAHLKDWYDRAAKAGFIFLRIRGGHNASAPTGWNKPPFTETPRRSRNPATALSWLRSGDNVGIGCGEETCIVGCDTLEAGLVVAGFIDDEMNARLVETDQCTEFMGRVVVGGHVDDPVVAPEGRLTRAYHVDPDGVDHLCLRVSTPRGEQYLFHGPRAGALRQTQGGGTAIPDVDTRAALRGYGMGPGSTRTAASYADIPEPPDDTEGPWHDDAGPDKQGPGDIPEALVDKELPPDDTGGPWHYYPGPDKQGPGDIPEALVDALFPDPAAEPKGTPASGAESREGRAMTTFDLATGEGRRTLAAWLDWRGILWMRAREDKQPQSTRPKQKGDGSLPWSAHQERGWLAEGRAQWIAEGGALIVCPSTVRLGTHGAAVADVDHGDLEANIAWLDEHVGSHPLLTMRRPDGAAKAHRWYASNVPRGANGNMHHGTDVVVGQWRGIGSSGETGGYVRLYEGELEALVRAIESGHFGHPLSPAGLDATKKPRARQPDGSPAPSLGARRDWSRQIAALTKGRHPACVAIVTSAINYGVQLGDETETAMRAAYRDIAPKTHGDPDKHWEAIWRDQDGWVKTNPPKGERRDDGAEAGNGAEPERDPKVDAWLREKGMLVEGKAVVPNTPSGYWLAMRWLRLDCRYEARRKQPEYRGADIGLTSTTHGLKLSAGGWLPADSSFGAWLRDYVAKHAVYEKHTKNEVQYIPLRLGRDRFAEFVGAIIHERRVDSFRAWLDALPEWDGVPRIDTLLHELFYMEKPEGPHHSDLQVWASGTVLLTAVARTYSPGLKVDEVLVLIGPQGCGKSTFGAWLLPPESRDIWFTDCVEFNGKPKEQLEAMKGRVIVEFGEMVGLGKADLGRVKSFITRLEDGSIRMAYRPDPEQTPRMCAFLLTTNVEAALPNDETGNRRFVTVRLDPTKEEARQALEPFLDEHREQLWAEARHRILVERESPRLPRHLKEVQKAGNERHRFRDAPIEDSILEALPRGVAEPGLTLEEIALLTDFTREKVTYSEEGDPRTTYKPWSQVVNREGCRLRQALLSSGDTDVVWRQTEKKCRVPGSRGGLTFRWYTQNADAPDGAPYRAEAASRKHDVGVVVPGSRPW